MFKSSSRSLFRVAIVAIIFLIVSAYSYSPTTAGGETPTPVVGNDGGNSNGPAPSEQTPVPADTTVPPAPTEVAATAVPATPVTVNPTNTPVIVDIQPSASPEVVGNQPAPSPEAILAPSKTPGISQIQSPPSIEPEPSCDGWNIKIVNPGYYLQFRWEYHKDSDPIKGDWKPEKINTKGGITFHFQWYGGDWGQADYTWDITRGPECPPFVVATNTSVPPTETNVPPSATPSATFTNTPQPSNTPTVTPSNTPLPSATPTYTETNTSTPVPPTFTATYTSTATATHTETPTVAPTYTFTPSQTPIPQQTVVNISVTATVAPVVIKTSGDECKEPAINGFMDFGGFNFQVQVLSEGRSKPKSMATKNLLASDASLSPNGEWVAFVAADPNGQFTEIRLARFVDLAKSWSVYKSYSNVVSAPAVNDNGDILFVVDFNDQDRRSEVLLVRKNGKPTEVVSPGDSPFWINNTTAGYINPSSLIYEWEIDQEIHSESGAYSLYGWVFMNEVTVARNGDLLAFVGSKNGISQIVVFNRITQSQIWQSPVGANQPVMSRDGRFIVFVHNGQIKAHQMNKAEDQITVITNVDKSVANPVLLCTNQVIFTLNGNTIVSVSYQPSMKSVSESGLTVLKSPSNNLLATYFGSHTQTRPEIKTGDSNFVRMANNLRLNLEKPATSIALLAQSFTSR